MIKRLTIKSFKSIKSVELECNRINVFIGSPNTGKSNILEALSYLSYFFSPKSKHGSNLEDFIRFDHRSVYFIIMRFLNQSILNLMNIHYKSNITKNY